MRNSQIDFLRPILFQIAKVSTDRLEKMESLKISFSSIRIWQPMKMYSNATMECKSLYRIWVFVEATPQIVLCRTTRVRYITYIDFSHERHLFSLLYIVAFYAYTRDDPCGTWRSCLHLHLKFVKITLKVDSTRRSRITGPTRLYPNKIFLSDGFRFALALSFRIFRRRSSNPIEAALQCPQRAILTDYACFFECFSSITLALRNS